MLTWQVVTQVSVVVAGLAAGGTFTVPVIRWIKSRLNTNGMWTNVLVWAFAVLVTLAIYIAEGSLAPGSVSPETWGLLVLAIVGQAEVRYRQIKDELG